MVAVPVLSMAAVTACGKRLEVADEKTMESVDEEIAQIPESAAREITAVYTLSGDVLSVDSGTAYIHLCKGITTGKKDASCWKTEIDGTDRYPDETGNILRNHMTPDGWYTDENGRKLWQIGMLLVTPGLYESMPAYSE